MEQKLSRYQNILILLITLLLHAGIILSIIIIKFDPPQTEAMVLLEDNEPTEQTPQNDWVTMAQSSQTPQPTLPQQPAQKPKQVPSEQHVEQGSAPILNDEQMKKAVSLAQKLLAHAEKRQPEQKAVEAPQKSKKQLTQQNQPKPSITLAQLTQGFMQHLQESPMTVRSTKQGQASIEQLQQMNYMQKVIACIVNSYKINNNRRLSGYSMQQARIKLALNKDGTIHTLQLVQSSGNITIDQFLISMFQDASSSFPPLPSSFKDQTFLLPIFNVDRLESFQSTNGWYIDSTMP